MQRVHLEVEVAQPAQLALELALPELQAKTTPPSTPSWRDAAPSKPLGSCVIELDLT